MTASTLKLSDLAGPDAAGWSDVAVFVRADGSESEPFVFKWHGYGEWLCVQHATDHEPVPKMGTLAVRRLGRGRMEPSRIVMEVEAQHPPVADLDAAALRLLRDVDTDAADRILVAQTYRRLAARVATLREACELATLNCEFCGGESSPCTICQHLRAALAATAPTPTEARK